jgi:hypothetical protein
MQARCVLARRGAVLVVEMEREMEAMVGNVSSATGCMGPPAHMGDTSIGTSITTFTFINHINQW